MSDAQLSKKRLIRRLSIDGMLIALFFVLKHFGSIEITANLKITFASLPIMVCALLYGPGDACLVAFTGELMNQLFRYGLSVTSPLWTLPPMLPGLVLGLFALLCCRAGRMPERRPVLLYPTALLAALLMTAANTVLICVDGLIMGVPVEFVLTETVFRFASGLITSVVVTTAAIPLVRALRRCHFGRALPAADDPAGKAKQPEQ